MAIIRMSVGFMATNDHVDVLMVQTLLNAIPASRGGALPALAIDGIAGPATNLAVAGFQQKQSKTVTGRIEPGDATESRLVAEVLAAGLGALLPPGVRPGTTPPAPGNAPPSPPPSAPGGATPDPAPARPAAPPPPPASPGAGDQLSPFRMQFRHIILSVLRIPKIGTTNGRAPAKTKPGDSGCGELPTRVWMRISPQDLVRRFECGRKNGVMQTLIDWGPNWHFKAEAIDARYPRPCWVPFRKGLSRQPKCGDIFVEVFTEKVGRHDADSFAHVGFVWAAHGGAWRTVESGQTNAFNPNLGPWSTGFRDRTVDGAGMMDDPARKRRLAGFVDVDVVYDHVVFHTGRTASPLAAMRAPQGRMVAPLRGRLFG